MFCNFHLEHKLWRHKWRNFRFCKRCRRAMRFLRLDSSEFFMGRGALRFSLSLIVSELWRQQWRHNEHADCTPPWWYRRRVRLLLPDAEDVTWSASAASSPTCLYSSVGELVRRRLSRCQTSYAQTRAEVPSSAHGHYCQECGVFTFLIHSVHMYDCKCTVLHPENIQRRTRNFDNIAKIPNIHSLQASTVTASANQSEMLHQISHWSVQCVNVLPLWGNNQKTRMWANAQRGGRPAEHSYISLLNKFFFDCRYEP